MSAGVLNQLSFKRETTWGTAVVPDKSIPVHFSGGIQTNLDIQFISALKTQYAKNIDSFIGKAAHEGDLEMDLFPDYPGYFVLSALGKVTTTLLETGVYQHVFAEDPDNAQKPSLTIEQVVGENVRRYAGSIVHTLKISGKAGEAVVLTASIKAKSQASATKITPAYLNVRPFNFKDSQVKIGGVSIGEVETWEFEYNNNLEAVYTLGSNDPYQMVPKSSEAKGSIEMYLDSTTLTELNNYLSKTERSIEIVLTGDTLGASNNYKVTISIPKGIFTTAETEITDNYNLLKIEFDSRYDTTTSKLLDITFVNTLANYN